MRMPPRIRVDPSLINDVYLPYLTDETRYQIFFGGSSSGKSFFLATRVVLDVLCGRNYLVLRNVAKTIRSSCWNEINKAIMRMGLPAYFKINKTDMTITSLCNGCQILFAGLDDVEKVKSITPANAALTDIWIEEATEIAYQDYKQLDKRLRGLTKHAKRLILSFNPVYKQHWIYTEFFGYWADDASQYRMKNLTILKTTYRDNRFLTSDDREALENERDPYYRDVYTDGNWGVLGDVIFRNWKAEDLTEFKKTADNIRMGLDFGFSSDPCGFVRLHIDKKNRIIYILDEYSERGHTNPQLAEMIKPICARGYVTCDSAEPKSIQELKNCGINALAAVKGPDSVIYGIQWLQQYRIRIDLSCQHTINEFTLYQWKQDKDGNSIRQPMDKNNHMIDAIRYATETDAAQRIATTAPRSKMGL